MKTFRGLSRAQSRGFIPLGIILAVVISIAVLGGGGYYALQHSASSSSQETVSSTPATQESSSTTSRPVSVSWDISLTNPAADSYKKDEQSVVVIVTFDNGGTKRYELGTAYGCESDITKKTEGSRTVYGFVNCYYSLSGTAFIAYKVGSGGDFIIERRDDDASGRTDGKVTILVRL